MLAAANLRPGLSSLSALSVTIEHALHFGPVLTGALTTVPVACMGVFSFLTGRLVRLFGPRAVTAGATGVIAASTALRLAGGHLSLLIASTLFLGAGIAIAQAVLPGIVQAVYARQILAVTSLYTAVLGLGAAAAAAVSVSVAQLTSWPVSLAIWSLPASAACLFWTLLADKSRPSSRVPPRSRPPSPSRPPFRGGPQWPVAIGFGAASVIYYTALAWIPQIVTAAGTDPQSGTIGLTLFTASQIPMPLLVAAVSSTRIGFPRLIRIAAGPTVAGLILLAVSPHELWWAGCVALGMGCGLLFPLMLSLPVLHSADPQDSSAIAGAGYGLGYIAAAPAPLVFGVIRASTGTFAVPLLALFLTSAALIVAAPLLVPPELRERSWPFSPRAGREHSPASRQPDGEQNATSRRRTAVMTRENDSEARHLVAARACFPHVSEGTFLNHAAVGRLSAQAVAAATAALNQMTHLRMPDAWDRADALRADLARLLGTEPGLVALTRSTAHGLAILAHGLDWRPGDNVVGLRYEYPANVLPWMGLADRGVAYRPVPVPADGDVARALANAINERTRLVTVSHVAFWNGLRVDIPALAKECHRNGVLLAVDVMQSVGAVRVDLNAFQADFVAAGDCKWLMGPAGIAFCYAAPDLLERLPPLILGPGGMRNRHEYYEPTLSYAASARRFEEGWLSMPDIAAMHAAVNLARATGIDWIESRVLMLAARFAESCEQLGFEIERPWPRPDFLGSGIVSVKHATVPSESLLAALDTERIIVSQRRGFIRVSPHYYNTEEEIAQAVAVLARSVAD
jgi:selenocysteine lyase/cysteine desulfurase/cyanate permease